MGWAELGRGWGGLYCTILCVSITTPTGGGGRGREGRAGRTDRAEDWLERGVFCTVGGLFATRQGCVLVPLNPHEK
jgi:hypothetical protein